MFIFPSILFGFSFSKVKEKYKFITKCYFFIIDKMILLKAGTEISDPIEDKKSSNSKSQSNF